MAKRAPKTHAYNGDEWTTMCGVLSDIDSCYWVVPSYPGGLGGVLRLKNLCGNCRRAVVALKKR